MDMQQWHNMTHDQNGDLFGFIIATEEKPRKKTEKPGLTVWMKGYTDKDFRSVVPYFLKCNNPDSFLVIDTRGAGRAYHFMDIVRRRFPDLIGAC